MENRKWLIEKNGVESFRYKNLEIYGDAKKFLKKSFGITREKEFHKSKEHLCQ
jgi:hypothetical protein